MPHENLSELRKHKLNLSTLRKEELKTTRKSKEEFKKELSFVEHLLNVFLKTFKVLHVKVHEGREFTDSEDACFRISYRIFRIVRWAFNSSLEGYYDVSMALVRIAFENYLLLVYLSESDEEEAKLWFKGKKFAPTFLRNHVDYRDSIYRDLSEYVHSSFRSTFAFTKTEKEEQFGTLGEYDREQFKNVLFLMVMTLFTTMVWLFCAIPEILASEEWRSYSMDGLIEVAKYIRAETSRTKGKKEAKS